MTRLLARLVLALSWARGIAAAPRPAGGGDVVALEAAPGQFPSQVALLRNNYLFCGGVLLNKNTVLSNRRCAATYPLDEVEIRLGSNNYNSGGIVVGVDRVRQYPNPYPPYIETDISLWTLSTPVAESKHIKFAQLPKQNADVSDREPLITSGWGTARMGFYEPSPALRFDHVAVVPRTTCTRWYADREISIFTEMFCTARYVDGLCQADAGGPVFYQRTGVLAGIVSWDYGCNTMEYPNVHTRIGSFVDWIARNLS
ncbi:trypsin-like serine protease [Marssonina coronariae]|uniref:Trypsin-like serine protease n=1 Tax=Diplocarpon coronariae TaxID=2795749 RepID=A0A218Z316_9HELO|nr:trypsin-like serine protease [Marssonina coronariae]